MIRLLKRKEIDNKLNYFTRHMSREYLKPKTSCKKSKNSPELTYSTKLVFILTVWREITLISLFKDTYYFSIIKINTRRIVKEKETIYKKKEWILRDKKKAYGYIFSNPFPYNFFLKVFHLTLCFKLNENYSKRIKKKTYVSANRSLVN